MLSVLAQRAASEGPRWTRADESIPVAPTYGPLVQPDHPYCGTLIKSGKVGRAPGSIKGVSENLLKRRIVSWLLKQRESSDTTVQDMIGEVSSSEARAAWHGPSCPLLRCPSDPGHLIPTPFLIFRFDMCRRSASMGDA